MSPSRRLLRHIPPDSALHLWIKACSISEMPISFQVGCALAVTGALLRRNVWIDQVLWKVYPNTSILLVGPSGIGKDVSISSAFDIIHTLAPDLYVGGKTMEVIVEKLSSLPAPACAVILAPELTAFLGGKDYQKSMVQELTDILSTGKQVDVSLRSTGTRIIRQPTITMMAGSTAEWLHSAMPSGSLEGGFFPRFLILCETEAGTSVPLLKYSLSTDEWMAAKQARSSFISSLSHLTKRQGELTLTHNATATYTHYYNTRFTIYPPSVKAYANRSRDQVLRLAMLSAVLRDAPFIDEEDIVFGVEVMRYVAESIDRIVLPPSTDSRVAERILELLPATPATIYRKLGRLFERRQIQSGLQLLMESDQIRLDGRRFVKCGS